jgi:hypothetical protein
MAQDKLSLSKRIKYYKCLGLVLGEGGRNLKVHYNNNTKQFGRSIMGSLHKPQTLIPPPEVTQSWVGVKPLIYWPQQKSFGDILVHFEAHIVHGHRARPPREEHPL